MKLNLLSGIICACTLFADTPTVFVGDSYAHEIAAISTDRTGNTYVTGKRVIYSEVDGYLGGPIPNNDVFVAKFDATNERVWIQYFEGKDDDSGTSVTTDSAGNVYIAGYTTSLDFPLRNPLQTEPANGFLMKLSPDGSRIIWSTYYGVRGTQISTIAIAPDGALVIGGGRTGKTTYYVNAPGFVAKVNVSANKLVWQQEFNGSQLGCTAGSSCFTSRRESTAMVAVDPSGNIYAAGNTNTLDFPTTAGALLERGYGPFVRKFSPSGTVLWSTYLTDNHVEINARPRPADTLNAIAVGQDGSVYLAGGGSPKWPTTPGAYKTSYGGPDWPIGAEGPRSPYVAKLNPNGTALTYSTFLGHAGTPAVSIAVDSGGVAYVSGGPIGDSPSDYITAVNQNGTAVVFDSTYARGSRGAGIVLDTSLHIHAAGAGGVVTIVEQTLPPSGLSGVANAAGLSVSGRVAPGELISIYGWGLGDQVFVDGIPANLLYVSANQINAVVPFGVAGRGRVTLSVRRNGVDTANAVVAVTSAQPEIFKTDGGYAAALNEDGTVNSKDNPAKPGSVVSVWGTGATGWPSGTPDGSLNPSTPLVFLPVSFLVDGWQGDTLFAGAAPGMVAGTFQMNIRIPSPVGRSVVDISAVSAKEVSSLFQVHVKHP
jgi:uncharacterized protein (TIGR03437 family)